MFKIVLTENESMIFGAKIQISLNLNNFEFSRQKMLKIVLTENELMIFGAKIAAVQISKSIFSAIFKAEFK